MVVVQPTVKRIEYSSGVSKTDQFSILIAAAFNALIDTGSLGYHHAIQLNPVLVSLPKLQPASIDFENPS